MLNTIGHSEWDACPATECTRKVITPVREGKPGHWCELSGFVMSLAMPVLKCVNGDWQGRMRDLYCFPECIRHFIGHHAK